MTNLDRDECARLLAMRDKATPGPWQAWASDGMMHITGHNAVEFDDGYNAVFAASAHNLANQLEAALAQIDRLKTVIRCEAENRDCVMIHDPNRSACDHTNCDYFMNRNKGEQK